MMKLEYISSYERKARKIKRRKNEDQENEQELNEKQIKIGVFPKEK